MIDPIRQSGYLIERNHKREMEIMRRDMMKILTRDSDPNRDYGVKSLSKNIRTAYINFISKN